MNRIFFRLLDIIIIYLLGFKLSSLYFPKVFEKFINVLDILQISIFKQYFSFINDCFLDGFRLSLASILKFRILEKLLKLKRITIYHILNLLRNDFVIFFFISWYVFISRSYLIDFFLEYLLVFGNEFDYQISFLFIEFV